MVDTGTFHSIVCRRKSIAASSKATTVLSHNWILWKETNERSVRIIFEMKVSIVRVCHLSKIGPIQRKPS